MATNEQIVEVVTFKADGLEQIAEGTQKLGQNATGLAQKYGQFAAAVEKAQRRNEQFARTLRDGSYERHVRQMARLNDQFLQLQRRADAIARYGPRLGAILGNGTVQAAGRFGLYAAGAGVATVGAMARSGLSGTVEGNRMNLEAQLLSREVAGVFKPLTDGVTNATMKIRKWMESLSGTEQDMLMYGGALVAGTVALRALLGANAFGALAGGAARGLMSAATSPLGFLAGNGRMLAGAAGLGLLAHGAYTNNSTTGAIGGGLAGAAAWGPLAPVGFVAGAAAGAPVDMRSERPSDYYARMRREGGSRFGAALSTGGRSVAKLFGADDADTTRERTETEKRRKVTGADAGFDAVGSGYERLSTALALVDASAAAAESTGLIAAMERLAAAFAAAAADPMPRPASGGGTS